MIDPEIQQLTLNICGNGIVTKVRRKDEEALKKVEKMVNAQYRDFELGHPSKKPQEILAMTAFQFAKLYYDKMVESAGREKELTDFMKTFEGRLNEILLKA